MAHARFEMMLMLVPEELAERRRRLMASALMAATLSMGLGVLSWTADKLGISAVTPPKHAYSVTLQVLEPPPPPATPPPSPSVVVTTDDKPARATPDEVVPEVEEAPIEVEPLDLDARPKPRTTLPSAAGSGGGSINGSPGIPGVGGRCLLPPCIGTQVLVGQPSVPQPRTPQAEAVQTPIKAVMASSIFTPNPDQLRLSRTATGRSHRRPGRSTVSFCINGDGKTYEVRTRKGFSGDAEVDEICRATVAKWRFSPQRVAGKARSTCTSVTFDIRFE